MHEASGLLTVGFLLIVAIYVQVRSCGSPR
jgi:hypothetical protein